MVWATERHRQYQMQAHIWDNFVPAFEFEFFFIWRISIFKAIGVHGWVEERKNCPGLDTRSHWRSLVIRLFVTPLGAAYFTPPPDCILHCHETLPIQVPAAQPSWRWAPRLHPSSSLLHLYHTHKHTYNTASSSPQQGLIRKRGTESSRWYSLPLLLEMESKVDGARPSSQRQSWNL